MPLTISLIGNSNEYFGIKAVTFNRDTYREEGVFLKVNSKEWLHTEEYISNLNRHIKKFKLRYLYDLPQILIDKGFEYIFNILKFSEDQVPFVENKFGDLTDHNNEMLKQTDDKLISPRLNNYFTRVDSLCRADIPE